MAHRDSSQSKDGAGANSTPAKSRPPTSADVARLAKVSQSTVSHVLNKVPDNRFTEETRQRVLAAAEQLGYIPHAMARSLRSGRSNLVIVPFLDLPFNPSSIRFEQTLVARLGELGYTVMLHTASSEPVVRAAQTWASLRPTGVIAQVEGLTQRTVELLYRAGVRAILAFGGTPSKLVPTALNSFVQVGRCAGEYLLHKGHRHIAVLVPRDPRILGMGIDRLQGIQQAGQYGLQIDRVDLQYNVADVAQIAMTWQQGPRPTAVFTYNDEYGMMLMSALQDVGLRVPEDIAMVGCDDLPLCEMVRPRLTSIQLAHNNGGFAVADFFDSIIRGEVSGPTVLNMNSPQLIVRDSS